MFQWLNEWGPPITSPQMCTQSKTVRIFYSWLCPIPKPLHLNFFPSEENYFYDHQEVPSRWHLTSRSSQLIPNILIYHTDRKYWMERLAHLQSPSTISNKKSELVEFESGVHWPLAIIKRSPMVFNSKLIGL